MERGCKGQALIEAAFVIPVVMTLFLIILAFGHLFSSQLVLVNASREGARLGALSASAPEITNAMHECLTGTGLDAAKVQITISLSGSKATVRLAYPLDLLFPVPGLPNPFLLSAQTIMRIEK